MTEKIPSTKKKLTRAMCGSKKRGDFENLRRSLTGGNVMPGRPIRRKMIADIREQGGLEIAVFDRLRDGESLTAVARSFGVHRSTLWRYLNSDTARYAKYELAQRQSAAAMVEDARQKLADVSEHAKDNANSAYVQAVRNEATYVQWQAGMTDRRAFGPPDHRTSVNVNIAELHLAALQALGGPDAQKLPETPADVLRLKPGDTREDHGT